MVHESVKAVKTIPELILRRGEASPNEAAHEHEVNGQWQLVTYGEWGRDCRQATLGFHRLGLQTGQSVGIWGDTMPQWTVLDIGALTCGAPVVGVYQTNADEQAVFILNDCKARYLC